MLSPSTHDWLRRTLDAVGAAFGWLRRSAAAGARGLSSRRLGPFRMPQSPNQAFIEANQEAAEESLRAAGASKAVAALVLQAGYTGPDAFRKAAWTAEEAGGRYQSAEWRISMQHGCTPATLDEVRLFHDRLVQGRPTLSPARSHAP